VKRIGVVLHATRERAADVAGQLAAALGARGVESVALAPDAARVPGTLEVTALDATLDLVIAFGGDGTLLRAAELVGDSGTPVLGINLGRLGFLSALEAHDLGAAADRLIADGLHVEERAVVSASIDGGPPVRALNDIIVEKQHAGRSIRLLVAIDSEPLVAWAADGVIVATPTGSTAYSMSAGGPIVSPRVACLVVTPVAPHGLFARSIVVPDDEAIDLRLTDESEPAGLSADGRPAVPLGPGARVAIRSAEHRVRLARLERSSFWRLLRDKFGLPAEQP
jgi:NAD+ kinase